MNKVTLLDDIQTKISQLFATNGVTGLDNPLKQLLQQSFAKLELVSAEDFEIQRQVLLRTREKLDALEKRMAELEARTSQDTP